jgi:IclR family acetate operon transcriptional repressor
MPDKYVIPKLRNACRILKHLGQGNSGFIAHDIASALSLPATTTLRIMNTLHLEGLVRKDRGQYFLGPVLIHLGNTALASIEMNALAQPVLQKLTRQTGETSHVAMPCDNRSLIVSVCDSPHPLRAASRPGALVELHCSATGKIFLSFLPDQLQKSYGDKRAIKHYSPRTITTYGGLKKETELTRKRGYSFDNEEFHDGVRCLAAPVRSSDGSVIAAVGITAGVVRFPLDRAAEIARHVQAAARELSQSLGYSE